MTFPLTDDHRRWAASARRKYGQSLEFWYDLIENQKGCCNLSGVPLKFDSESGTPIRGGAGCHPLYAAADHIDPILRNSGVSVEVKFQLLCYDINDLKGHMPRVLFDALCKTEEWKQFMLDWRKVASQDSSNRAAFKMLIAQGYL